MMHATDQTIRMAFPNRNSCLEGPCPFAAWVYVSRECLTADDSIESRAQQLRMANASMHDAPITERRGTTAEGFPAIVVGVILPNGSGELLHQTTFVEVTSRAGIRSCVTIQATTPHELKDSVGQLVCRLVTVDLDVEDANDRDDVRIRSA